MPDVTLIVSFYNRPAAVEVTLNPLLQQSHKDFEIIAIDDGSTDATYEALLKFEERVSDNRLKVRLNSPNVGLTKTLSATVACTDSEFVAIHDAGDISSTRRIELQREALSERPDVSVVGSHYINFAPLSGFMRLRRPNASTVDLSALRRSNTFSHGEVMFRRSHYERAGGYRNAFRFSQDYDLWLRMAEFSSFATVPEVLYTRIVDFSGISFRPQSFLRQTAFRIIAVELSKGELDYEQFAIDMANGADPMTYVDTGATDFQAIVNSAILRACLFGEVITKRQLKEFAYADELNHATLSLLPTRLLIAAASRSEFARRVMRRVLSVHHSH